MLLPLVAALGAASAARLDAGDALVSWAGRRNIASGSVSFDWVGVAARVKVVNATFVRAVVATSAPFRGTRLKAYGSDAGYLMMPTVQFWVDARGGSDRRPANGRARSIDARLRTQRARAFDRRSPAKQSDPVALGRLRRVRPVARGAAPRRDRDGGEPRVAPVRHGRHHRPPLRDRRRLRRPRARGAARRRGRALHRVRRRLDHSGDQGRTRVIQRRFNVSVPRARVLEIASKRRERSER